jgi:hypothetical protein
VKHNMSKLNQPGRPQVSSMNALVIYDDISAFARANNALQHSAQNKDFTVRWNIRPWRIDMLKFPTTAEDVLTEAIDAHLIVFAGRIEQSLSFWMQDWLEQWAKHRRVEDAALAVIGAGNTKAVLSQSDLCQFAKRHGLSVIFDDRGVIEDPLFHAVSLQKPKHSKSPSLLQILDTKPRDEDWFRQWGINE